MWNGVYPQKSKGSSGSESIDQREIPSWLGMPKGTWWLKGERERERERGREGVGFSRFPNHAFCCTLGFGLYLLWETLCCCRYICFDEVFSEQQWISFSSRELLLCQCFFFFGFGFGFGIQVLVQAANLQGCAAAGLGQT